METKSRKAEHAESTRAALLAVAQQLFAERGYAETSTEEIVQRARVTRGALYHHFRDKRDLFEAVVEEMEAGIATRLVAAAAGETDPWRRLHTGLGAFLDACEEPAIQRVLLMDAPSVLGWEKWREIDAKYGFGMLKGGLQAAMDSGAIKPQPVDPLAHLLTGAVMEAAMVIATAKDVRSARAEVGATLERLMEGLRAS
ncbi:MAG: helix-turn-helix domain-containing protein [Dehalococcoidia bacterium]